ncbi:hypothetical protein [Vibrio owensii]|uniref:hypothetical protein n=1 Tax=Vibrio harveyi group TaxID=717610 RepID=UPI003CC50268
MQKRTYFHGTSLENARKILKEGLVNKMPDSANWFTMATDMESATIYQKQSKQDPNHHYILELNVELPEEDLENGVYWTGYPMLWPEYDFKEVSKDGEDKIWVSNREVVPASCVVGVHRMNVHTHEIEKLNLSGLSASKDQEAALER